jgi:hypothetical protein
MQNTPARRVFLARKCLDCPVRFTPTGAKQVRCPDCQAVESAKVVREARAREMIRRKAVRAEARLAGPRCSVCRAPLRKNNTIGRCQEHRYIGEGMGACTHCGKPVRRDNQSGYCEEHKYATSRAPVRFCASSEGCGRQLRIDNESGYCARHFSESPLWRECRDRFNAKLREQNRLRPDERRFCSEPRCPNRLRSDNTTGRCAGHVYIPVDMPECTVERCTNRLTVRNTTGRCWEEHHAKYWVAEQCGHVGCEQILHEDNSLGYCHEHRSEAEQHQEYMRAYYQSRKAEFQAYAKAWRLANGDDHRAAVRAWSTANREARQAMHARRRTRIKVAMTDLDRQQSVARRRDIKNNPCFYCGTAETSDTDHFFPLAKGGTDHWWNLVRACDPCNSRKNATCGTAFLLRAGGLTLT